MPTITVKAKPVPSQIRARRGAMTAISLNRSKIADQWLPGYRRSIAQTLDRYVNKVAMAMQIGMQFPDSATAQHLKDYTAVKRRWTARIAQDGWEKSGDELALLNPLTTDKTARIWRGKDEAPSVMIGGTERKDLAARESSNRNNEFLLRADFPKMDKWVATTSAKEVATDANRLEQVWKDAEASRDPKTGWAWTTRDMSKAIQECGLAGDAVRADMLARTGTVWAINEGALQRYVTAGVTVTEWLATRDDITCPFCLVMHNQVVSVGTPFWEGGDDLAVEKPDGKIITLKVPENVDHPPIHPRCRCTLLPVLRTQRVAIEPVKPAPVPEQKPLPIIAKPKRKQPWNMNQQEFAAYTNRIGEKITRQTAKLEARIARLDTKITSARSNVRFERFALERSEAHGLPGIAAREAKLLKNSEDLMDLTMQHRRLAERRGQTVTRLLKKKNHATLTTKMRTRDKKLRDVALRANRDIASIVSKHSVPTDVNYEVVLTARRRSFHSTSRVNLSRGSPYGTAVHELGHELEDVGSTTGTGIHQASREFFERRTAGKKLVSLRDLSPNRRWDDDEVAFADTGFIDDYTAKKYKFASTETVSMGFEHLMTDPVGFFQKDPDHFRLIMQITQGAI